MELGTSGWLTAVVRAVNESDAYRRAAAGWRWPLGLGFLDPERPRFAVLDLRDGQCHGAQVADRRTYERAPFRLSADTDEWCRVLDDGADPMRCILLRDLRLEGERLTALRYLPAVKALLHAMATVDRGAAVS